MRSYYKGDIHTLLSNMIKFLSDMFHIYYSNDSYNIRFNDNWSFKIDDNNLLIIREDATRFYKSYVYHISNKNEYNFSDITFEEGEWMECVLACIIPSSAYIEILTKLSIEIPKEMGRSKYKSVAREVKLKMILDEI